MNAMIQTALQGLKDKSTNKLMSVPMTLLAPLISFLEVITQIHLEFNSI